MGGWSHSLARYVNGDGFPSFFHSSSLSFCTHFYTSAKQLLFVHSTTRIIPTSDTKRYYVRGLLARMSNTGPENINPAPNGHPNADTTHPAPQAIVTPSSQAGMFETKRSCSTNQENGLTLHSDSVCRGSEYQRNPSASNMLHAEPPRAWNPSVLSARRTASR